jgi:hypothetical protein
MEMDRFAATSVARQLLGRLSPAQQKTAGGDRRSMAA